MKVWSKRHRDLGRSWTQLVCRLHAVLCELVPGGGISKELSVGSAEKALADIEPQGAVAAARYELADAFIDDLRRIDGQIRDTKKRIEAAVTASKTTVTEIFRAGPVIATMVKGDTGDVRRFTTRDRFASYNGTAPIDVSSAPKKIYRLSLPGNRRMNHAIHMIAVTQLRFPHTDGRAYFVRKLAEGKTGKEALRSVKWRISERSTPGCSKTCDEKTSPEKAVREGTRGTSPHPARPAQTLDTGSSEKPLRDRHQAYDHTANPEPGQRARPMENTRRPS